MGRKLRTRLDLLYPNVGRYAQMQREKQKEAHDKSAKERPEFNTGSAVYARDFSKRAQKWETGTVVEQTGPVSYRVMREDGTVRPYHLDQLCQNCAGNTRPDVGEPELRPETDEQDAITDMERTQATCTGEMGMSCTAAKETATAVSERLQEDETTTATSEGLQKDDGKHGSNEDNVLLRRSSRVRRKPERLDL